MNVSVTALKNKGFLVKEPIPGYALVHPSRGKWDWEPDELGLRSIILETSSGRVVSTGWPKFFNQGEWPDHDVSAERPRNPICVRGHLPSPPASLASKSRTP